MSQTNTQSSMSSSGIQCHAFPLSDNENLGLSHAAVKLLNSIQLPDQLAGIHDTAAQSVAGMMSTLLPDVQMPDLPTVYSSPVPRATRNNPRVMQIATIVKELLIRQQLSKQLYQHHLRQDKMLVKAAFLMLQTELNEISGRDPDDVAREHSYSHVTAPGRDDGSKAGAVPLFGARKKIFIPEPSKQLLVDKTTDVKPPKKKLCTAKKSTASGDLKWKLQSIAGKEQEEVEILRENGKSLAAASPDQRCISCNR